MNNNIYIGYKWYVPKEEYDNVEKICLEQDKTIRELDKKNKQATKDIMDLKQTIADKEHIINKAIEYCNNNIEFTERLVDVIDILKGDSNE